MGLKLNACYHDNVVRLEKVSQLSVKLDGLHSDTIVAPITGSGPAAVAVIRLSGPSSFEIASSLFTPWPDPVVPRFALVGRYKFGETGIALPFAEGASFTGQQVVELSVHGGRASVNALVDGCIRAGARMALPGEFSLRAFLEGAIDLSQAEAIADMVESQTERQLRLANLNLNGGLRRTIHQLIDSVSGELARVEVSVDFSEEVGEFDFEAASIAYSDMISRLSDLHLRGRYAHLARRGVRIALVGRPNAGKSSLLNAILDSDRAIVTPIAGTTRDTIEESVDWNGLKVVLIDTAGIRETSEQIEEIGIARSLEAAAGADEVFYLFDASLGWSEEDDEALGRIDRPVTVVGNKSDLRLTDRGLAVSAQTGAGLNLLFEQIAQRYDMESDFTPLNDRQAAHIALALESMERAELACRSFSPPDLIGVLLKQCIDELGLVVGLTASPDMLNEIFSRFCIGK